MFLDEFMGSSSMAGERGGKDSPAGQSDCTHPLRVYQQGWAMGSALQERTLLHVVMEPWIGFLSVLQKKIGQTNFP